MTFHHPLTLQLPRLRHRSSGCLLSCSLPLPSQIIPQVLVEPYEPSNHGWKQKSLGGVQHGSTVEKKYVIASWLLRNMCNKRQIISPYKVRVRRYNRLYSYILIFESYDLSCNTLTPGQNGTSAEYRFWMMRVGSTVQSNREQLCYYCINQCKSKIIVRSCKSNSYSSSLSRKNLSSFRFHIQDMTYTLVIQEHQSDMINGEVVRGHLSNIPHAFLHPWHLQIALQCLMFLQPQNHHWMAT